MVEEFSKESVQALSALKKEPTWMLDRRLEAWAAFEALPLPGPSNEVWRHTDFSFLEWEQFLPYALPAEEMGRLEGLPHKIRQGSFVDQNCAGVSVQIDSATVFTRSSKMLAKKGIIFASLEEGIHRFPELCQEYLMTQGVQPSENKFAALHGAFWGDGVLLYLPPGISEEQPFYASVYCSRPSLALFHHTLIILDKGSSATFVQEVCSQNSQTPVLNIPVIEVFLKEGAQLRYINRVEWEGPSITISFQRNILGRNARIETLSMHSGGRIHKAHVESHLKEPGGISNMMGMSFGEGNQQFDHYTLQEHLAPHTQSDLLYKMALRDQSRSVYYGIIRIAKDAPGSHAFQTNRNLILGEEARADSIPVLEIEADDVKCSHAAAMGPVDQDQLFYLMTRGLHYQEAVKMLVEAFFEPILVRIPEDLLRGKLRAWLHRKIGVL